MLSHCLFISRTRAVLWSRVHLSPFSVCISEMNKEGKLWLKCSFYRKNSVPLHWTVIGTGRLPNFADAAEPVLCSLPSFLKLSTFKTFPPNRPEYWAVENFRLDRGPNPWVSRWISFLLRGLRWKPSVLLHTQAVSLVLFSGHLERQWTKSPRWPLSGLPEMTA